MREMLGRDAASFIGYPQLCALRDWPAADRNLLAGRTVAETILDEIHEQLNQEVFVTDDRQRRRRRDNRHPLLLGAGVVLAGNQLNELGKVD